jgi:hypothetical protein
MAQLPLQLLKSKSIQFVGRSLVVATALTSLSSLPLLSQSSEPLLSPEAAARRAENLSPEALTNLTLDEELRDRLRFDPTWQPILRAVQQDIMILKWGNNQLTNPVWKRFGAKAYPLLDYYTRSADPTRQVYGMVGIRALGKPYTTLWLEQQLQRQANHPDFYLVTGNPALLLDPNADAPYEWDWQSEFGLDDPATRDRLIQIAQQHLEPQSDLSYRRYYDQFNLGFLTELLGYEAMFPPQPSPFDPQEAPDIREWEQAEQLTQPTAAQVQQAIAYYRNQEAGVQNYILVQRLGSVEAGNVSPVGKALLETLANDPNSSDRIWAIAELDRHGDPQGSTLMQAALNGDLSQLYDLTRYASYGIFSLGDDRSSHAYYLLVNLAEKYPQSKFVQAARAYGEMRGIYYFGGEPRSETSLQQVAEKPAAQREQEWRDWLSRYPDHPGADDATYFLARSLQDQNQVEAAMELWIKMMIQPVGDGDASYLAYPFVRSLLDVGLTTEQIANLAEQYQDEAIAPLLEYALAVRYARSHDYTKALATSEALDLAELQPVLDSYYGVDDRLSYFLNQSSQSAIAEMQTMLTEQRQRWQRLEQLQAENTPSSRYGLASDWAGEGGWKNGYLAIWDSNRTYYLPTGAWGGYYCEIFWVCNTKLREPEAIRSAYQQASQNAIALDLYQKLIDDPNTPSDLQEKALFMAASTLLWQWEDYPLGETFRIHPPAGVPGNLVAPEPNAGDAYDAWQVTYKQVEQNYLSYLDTTITQLQQHHPQSAYIDDLLFSRYAISGERPYLQQIVDRYPEGDRATEARFLLAHQRERSNE